MVAVAGPLLCGHDGASQRIAEADQPEHRWCGSCYGTWRRLQLAYPNGDIPEAGLRDGLVRLLHGFTPPLSAAEVSAQVELAVHDVNTLLTEQAQEDRTHGA